MPNRPMVGAANLLGGRLMNSSRKVRYASPTSLVDAPLFSLPCFSYNMVT